MLTTIALLTSLLSNPVPVTPAPEVPTLDTEASEFKVMVADTPRPIRSLRRISVLGEFGFNGLAGTGLNLSANLHPNWSIDSGFGLGLGGYKLGLRGRYNLLKSNVTPFVAAGAAMTFGNQGSVMPMDLGANGRGSVQLKPAPFAQAVAGLSWVNDSGFALLASLGWSQLIGELAYTVQPGSSYTADGAKAVSAVYGSGPVASLAMGYAF